MKLGSFKSGIDKILIANIFLRFILGEYATVVIWL